VVFRLNVQLRKKGYMLKESQERAKHASDNGQYATQ